MLIEDSEDLRELVAHILADEGFQISPFSNGDQALHAIEKGFRPKVILLDWRMPVMTGEEFLKNYQVISQDDATLVAPIYIFSAENDHRIFEHVKCQGIIRKPVDVDQLIAIAKKHCA